MQSRRRYSAAEAGATIVIDAGIVSASDGGSPLSLTATGCDFGDLQARGGDVVVRAWVRKGRVGTQGVQAPPVAVNEILQVRPCAVPLAAAAAWQSRGSNGHQCRRLRNGSGAAAACAEVARQQRRQRRDMYGTRHAGRRQVWQDHARMLLLWRALPRQSLMFAAAAAKGCCWRTAAASAATAAEEAWCSTTTPPPWWTGDVRVEAARQGKAWGECVLHEGSVGQQQQELAFETGVDGEACVQGVRVPPLGFLRISCAHVPDD